MGYEECQCDDHWIGLSCEIPTCNDKNNCSSNGECVYPNECECFEQYDGENCTEQVSENLNSPMFINTSYSAVVSENRGKGFVVLTVSANDSDYGRSGEISYAVKQENIENFFTIGQDSGEIKVAADGVLDYESISQKQYTFLVSATDNGFPPRSSEATVTITVEDENDNCPVFQTVSGQYKIPVEILANDDDNGNNGKIQYSITQRSDPDGNFFITSNGTLLANGKLQPGAYLLIIIARDGGIVPCSRELSLTIIIYEIVSSNEAHPTSSLISMGTWLVLPTNSFIFQQSSSLIHTKATALQPSTSIESSTITLSPSSTSSLASSNTILKTPLSPFKSSAIVLPLSQTLQSNTTMPQPFSLLTSSATDAPSLTITDDKNVSSNEVLPTSSQISMGTSFVLSTYSSMILQSSLSIQTKVTAVQPSSSNILSTITLHQSSTSSFPSSNTVQKTPLSPFKSSAIFLPPSQTLQSNTTMQQPFSLLTSSLSATDAPSLTIIADKNVSSNKILPTSSQISMGTSFVLSTYSSMILQSSLLIHTKVTALQPSSPIESIL